MGVITAKQKTKQNYTSFVKLIYILFDNTTQFSNIWNGLA